MTKGFSRVTLIETIGQTFFYQLKERPDDELSKRAIALLVELLDKSVGDPPVEFVFDAIDRLCPTKKKKGPLTREHRRQWIKENDFPF